VSSQVNRQLNCETANIEKTVGSAIKQVAAIERLERNGRLDDLSPALREIARARRAKPDLNLTELADHLQLSKSAVNHRLRRLLEVAEEPAPAHETASV
jgi:cell division protein WhiA